MCYTGGPYCYGQAETRLKTALADYEANPDDPETFKAVVMRKLEYNGTGIRQKELKASIEKAISLGQHEHAEQLKSALKKSAKHRKKQLAQAKKRKAIEQQHEIARINVPLAEAPTHSTPKPLTQQIMNLGEDEYYKSQQKIGNQELDMDDVDHDLNLAKKRFLTLAKEGDWVKDGGPLRGLKNIENQNVSSTSDNTVIPRDGSMAEMKSDNPDKRIYKGFYNEDEVVEVVFYKYDDYNESTAVKANITVYTTKDEPHDPLDKKEKKGLLSFFKKEKKLTAEEEQLERMYKAQRSIPIESESGERQDMFRGRVSNPESFESQSQYITSLDMTEVKASSLKNLHTALQKHTYTTIAHDALEYEYDTNKNNVMSPILRDRLREARSRLISTDSDVQDAFLEANKDVQEARQNKLFKIFQED